MCAACSKHCPLQQPALHIVNHVQDAAHAFNENCWQPAALPSAVLSFPALMVVLVLVMLMLNKHASCKAAQGSKRWSCQAVMLFLWAGRVLLVAGCVAARSCIPSINQWKLRLPLPVCCCVVMLPTSSNFTLPLRCQLPCMHGRS